MPTPQEWLLQIFDADAAKNGGVVRRSVEDVEKMIGRDALLAEVKGKGFHLIETGGQFVVLCNPGEIRIHC